MVQAPPGVAGSLKDQVRFQFEKLKSASSRAGRPVHVAECSSGKSRGGTAAQEEFS